MKRQNLQNYSPTKRFLDFYTVFIQLFMPVMFDQQFFRKTKRKKVWYNISSRYLYGNIENHIKQ